VKLQVILTLIPLCQEVPEHASGLFELYGFDFLIDQNFKTWILEANLSPAMSIESETDVTVKKSLLHDTLLLLDVAADDGTKAMQESNQKGTLDGKRSSKGMPFRKDTTIWAPKRCGGFEKIFPFPELNEIRELRRFPKVGDPNMKLLLLQIKKLYKT
jgi:hypothetical protein